MSVLRKTEMAVIADYCDSGTIAHCLVVYM